MNTQLVTHKIVVDNEYRTCKVLYVKGNPSTDIMLKSREVDLVVCLYPEIPEGTSEDDIESNKLCELLKVMCSITMRNEDGTIGTTKGTHDLELNKFKCYHLSGCDSIIQSVGIKLNTAIEAVRSKVQALLTERFNTSYGSVGISLDTTVNPLTLAISNIVDGSND